MNESHAPEMKNSDAPGDQDQAAEQSPAEVDGLAEQVEEETEESEGGYDH